MKFTLILNKIKLAHLEELYKLSPANFVSKFMSCDDALFGTYLILKG